MSENEEMVIEDPCEGCKAAPIDCEGLENCKIAVCNCGTCANKDTKICDDCFESFGGLMFDRPNKWCCIKKTT